MGRRLSASTHAAVVRLGVLASASILFALTWLGVVAPRPEPVETAVERPTRRLVSAPTPRRIVVVRRSRAS